MARGEQIERHWNLLRTLPARGAGVPLRELAERLEVSERTIQRDLEMLIELRFPITHQEDEYGKRYWRLAQNLFKTGSLSLSLTEAIALHLAQRLFSPLAGTPLADGLRDVLDQIRGLLPPVALEYFADLDETLYVRPAGETDYAPYAATIRTLTEAVRAQRTVSFSYHAAWRGEQYVTRCDPYGLVYYEGGLFLVGRSHRVNAVRVFKVTRMTELQRTQESFERPADFSLERHFAASFGIMRGEGEPVDIVVRFRGPAVILIQERVWHESQRLEWLVEGPAAAEPDSTTSAASANGAAGEDTSPPEPAVLQARFRLANVVEFKRWLRGFGAAAEVVAPAWLRNEMRAELRAALEQYEGDQGRP